LEPRGALKERRPTESHRGKRVRRKVRNPDENGAPALPEEGIQWKRFNFGIGVNRATISRDAATRNSLGFGAHRSP